MESPISSVDHVLSTVTGPVPSGVLRASGAARRGRPAGPIASAEYFIMDGPVSQHLSSVILRKAGAESFPGPDGARTGDRLISDH